MIFCALTNPGFYEQVAFNGYLGAIEAKTASKQPQRSNMA